MSSIAKKLTITDFKCMMCDEILAFDTDDLHTYVSKSSAEDFFSMKLSRYVVKHDTADEEHVNVIIVDQNHKYRGHKDYYKNAKSKSNFTIVTFSLPSNKIDLLLVIDLKSNITLEYINKDNNVKTTVLASKITEFINQNLELYEHFQEIVLFEYLSKKYLISPLSNKIFTILLVNDANTSLGIPFLKLLRYLSKESEIFLTASVLNPILKIVFKIIERDDFRTDDLSLLESLSKVYFTTKLSINEEYKSKSDLIIKLTRKYYPLAEIILPALLKSNKTVAELMEEEVFFNNYKDIIKLVNFIDANKFIS